MTTELAINTANLPAEANEGNTTVKTAAFSAYMNSLHTQQGDKYDLVKEKFPKAEKGDPILWVPGENERTPLWFSNGPTGDLRMITWKEKTYFVKKNKDDYNITEGVKLDGTGFEKDGYKEHTEAVVIISTPEGVVPVTLNMPGSRARGLKSILRAVNKRVNETDDWVKDGTDKADQDYRAALVAKKVPARLCMFGTIDSKWVSKGKFNFAQWTSTISTTNPKTLETVVKAFENPAFKEALDAAVSNFESECAKWDELAEKTAKGEKLTTD